MYFFGEMRGAIKASESPVCVHETDDEGYSILLPAGVIDKGREDEASVLVCRRNGWNGDEYHGEGKQ